MRDLDTIQTTLTMAETGHLVLGTLHTNDTSQAVDRLVDVFPTGRQAQIRVQLANSLTGIIYQQLLPKIGGGQVAAFEVLVATHATRSLIRDGKSNQLRNVLLTGQSDGMQTLESALSDLVARGSVTYDDAVGRSLYPKEVSSDRPPHRPRSDRQYGRGPGAVRPALDPSHRQRLTEAASVNVTRSEGA